MERRSSPPPPSPSPLPPSLLDYVSSFVDVHFKVPGDLLAASTLAANLEKDCRVLETDLVLLSERLDVAVRKWTAPLEDARSILSGERSRLGEWKRLHSSNHLGDCDGEGKKAGTRVGRSLGVDLPLLAKELRRIETIRLYAETSLHLEALVGDLEDAALSHMGQNPKSTIPIKLPNASSSTDLGYKQEKLLASVKAMRGIEEVLVTITKNRTNWGHLIAAVDSRVEKILSILRPQALRDYRAILSSLGWPPPLSSESDKESAKLPNPLLVMLADKKEKFSQSFLSLCSLQHLQACRDVRQRSYLVLRDRVAQDFIESSDIVCLDHNLWTIDELVFPLASRMEHHFLMWTEEPKFIFALVYKIARDSLEGVDNVLQPLIDKARLVGYSAREAWVLAMVKMLSTYITGRVFPDLVKAYDINSENTDVISSWLHLIDLVISFDKRMVALASSGVVLEGVPSSFAGNPPTLLFLIFHGHSDWLQVWAEIELRDAEEKLRSELQNERFWEIDINKKSEFIHESEDRPFLLSTQEDYKSPCFADSIIKIAWAMIEKCKMLPSLSMRLQFIRSSVCVLLHWFHQVLLQRCEVMDSSTAIMGDEVLLRVIGSVNAARYCESVMQEWDENMSLIELSVFAKNDTVGREKDEIHQSFFQEEIKNMSKFETDCLVDIMSSLLLEFEFSSRDYIQNKMYWEETNINELEVDEDSDIEQMSVSGAFIEALSMLKDRLESLKSLLNFRDFSDCWRNTAGGLDHFIFNSIALNVKFSSYGARQFKADMRALFLVFKPFCVRPEAFFPYTSDSLELLVMPWEDAKFLIVCQSQDDIRNWLHLHGISRISLSEARTILSNREFADQPKKIIL